MSSQISDYIKYNDCEYSIAAIENEWPFNPEIYGFRPRATSTANYRGYYCRYAIKDDQLLLDTLYIQLEEDETPTFRGIAAQKGKYYKTNHLFEYRDIGFLINYSGGMIIGNEFLQEFYVHMGFQRAHCYKYVKEILFEDGKIIEVMDHSEKMEQVRKSIRDNKTKKGDLISK